MASELGIDTQALASSDVKTQPLPISVIDPTNLELRKGEWDPTVKAVEKKYDCTVSVDRPIQLLIDRGYKLIAQDLTVEDLKSLDPNREKPLPPAIQGAVIFKISSEIDGYTDTIGGCIFKKGLLDRVIPIDEYPSLTVLIKKGGKQYKIGERKQTVQ